MGSIKECKDKDGKVRYHVQIRIKGSPPQHGSFKRKTDAERWIQHTESAIREGRHFKSSEAKRRTLGQMIDRYIADVLPTKKKSEHKQTMQLNWWKNQIGSYYLCDITPSLIVEQRDILLKGVTCRNKVRNPATVVRYMAVLSHAFTVAIKEWGWVDDSPLRKVTKPKESRGRIRFLDDNERVQLLQACKESPNPYLYTMVVLALSTGMRLGELKKIKWVHLEIDKGRIVLYETKNQQIRQVALAGLSLELIRELERNRRLDSHYLFPGKFPNKPVDIRSAWETVLKKTGISNFTFHDLRHTCASYLAMNGASLAEIKECLGHKTHAMVTRYAHLSEVHTAGVVSRMNEKIFG